MTIESADSAATTGPTPTYTRATRLRGLCGGAVHLPGDPGYDAARMPWNVAVDQRPAAVAYPASADEVADVVRAAAAAGLRVAPQGTGHNAGPLGDLEDAVLLRTSAMTGVEIDAERRTARVEAGVLWLDVVEAAARTASPRCTAPPPTSAWSATRWAAASAGTPASWGWPPTASPPSTWCSATARQLRADADTNPDVFWAVRGGGGNFGIVTAMEFRLFDIETAYAGMLMWDQEHAERVLRAWARWTDDAPDCVTTSFRMLNLPPMPELPQFLRGRQLVVIDGAVLADDERAEEILADLRALEPEMDTFARVPAASWCGCTWTPRARRPAVSASTILADLPGRRDRDVPGAHRPGLRLDAAVRRAAPARWGAGPAGRGRRRAADARRAVRAVRRGDRGDAGDGPAGPRRRRRAGRRDVRRTPRDATTSTSRSPRSTSGKSFPEQTWQRLKGIRSAVDPTGPC